MKKRRGKKSLSGKIPQKFGVTLTWLNGGKGIATKTNEPQLFIFEAVQNNGRTDAGV